MGCGGSRERRDHRDQQREPTASTTPLRPNCGLCESPVHPDDRCNHSCGQAFHTVCFESLVEGDNAACPRCNRPLLAGVATNVETRQHNQPFGGPVAGGNRAPHQRRNPHVAGSAAQSAALFRALIAELEAMRRVLDQQERAVTAPEPLDRALQPRPANPSADDDDCPVCQDSLRGAKSCVALPCRHVFHASCADDWLQLKRECPLCRAPAHPSRLRNDE